MNPQKEHAADFIIDTIKKHPGEVTIVAIGSGANLAAALTRLRKLLRWLNALFIWQALSSAKAT